MTSSGAGVSAGVKPIYQITVDGVDVTTILGDRLVGLRTTDYAGQQADVVELEFDDRDARIDAPPSGATLTVSVGYKGKGLFLVGSFIVDEVEFANGPRGMVVKGLGVGASDGLYSSNGGRGPAAGSVGGRGMAALVAGARAAGFTGDQIPLMAAIGMAESSGNPTALNNNPARGGLAYGLWQVNMFGALGPERRRQFGLSSNDALYDPATNARAARSIFQSQGLNAWEVYRTGAYRQYLPAARAEYRQQTTVPAPPSLPPRSGAASNIRDFIKLRRTQDWHNPPYKTLIDIAREIAGRNGFALEIKGDVPVIENRHEDQTNESDANFLTRLANRFGLVIKPADGRLLIAVRGEGAVGKNLDLVQGDVESWRARTKQRQRYKKIRAKYIDRGSRKEKLVSVTAKESVDGSIYELAELHRTKEDAERAAQAKLDGLTAGIFEIDLVMKGAPSLTAEGTVTLKGFRQYVDGTWVIQSVSHTITGTAMFSTAVRAGTAATADGDGDGGGPTRPGTGQIIATTGGDQSGPTRGRSTGAHLHSQVSGGLSEAAHRRLVDAAITVNGRAPSSFGQSRGHQDDHRGSIDFQTPSGLPIRLNQGYSFRNLGVQGNLGLGVTITGPGGSFTLGHLRSAN